jgi:NADH-quinone oxidoreductase subunit F
MGISVGYNYIHGEIFQSLRALRGRRWKRRVRRLLGNRILGSGFSFQLHALHGFGAYICGEETALLESLEGKKGQPRFKPPFPASFGLYGKPTTINNTETFAAVPWIIRNGGAGLPGLRQAQQRRHQDLFGQSAMSSARATTRSRWARRSAKLLELAGGVRGGRKLKAVIPGGSSAPVLPADIMMECTMDYDSIAKAGSMLGSGAVIVMDDTAAWSSRCSACRISTCTSPAASARPAAKARAGCGAWSTASKTARAVQRHGPARTSVADNIQGRTICALGDAAAMPVRAMIKHFRPRIRSVPRSEHKTCMARLRLIARKAYG